MYGRPNRKIINDLEEIPDVYNSDDEEEFPSAGFEILRSLRLMVFNVPSQFGGGGVGIVSNNERLLKTLMNVGSYDLSLGRIYEGHVNALSLIESFGTCWQKESISRRRFPESFLEYETPNSIQDP